MVWTVIGVLLLAGWLYWYATLTPEQRQARRAKQNRLLAERITQDASMGKVGTRKRLSQAGVRGEGGVGIACPRCGGMQFTAKRSMKGKVAVGILAPKTQVRCVTCGAMYKRG